MPRSAAKMSLMTRRSRVVRASRTYPVRVDLSGRAHSHLSRYRFIARWIRGFSLIAHRRHFETLAILKAERA